MAKQYEMERVEPENVFMNVCTKDSCRLCQSASVVIVYLFMCFAKPKCCNCAYVHVYCKTKVLRYIRFVFFSRLVYFLSFVLFRSIR